jgi:nicotinamidase-related amidase
LQIRGVETVIITGVATHGCVIGTSYAAQALNHYVVVVEDCVDSWKPDLHEAALHVLRSTMNYVTTAEAVTQIWRAAAKRRSQAQTLVR